MGHNEQKQGTEPLRAVVYVRISHDAEGTERGADRQEADCRAYAEAHGWEVVAVFRENDTSAFKQRTITLPSGERVRRVVRPQFRAMLKCLGDGQAQVMIAYDLDRAVRDPRDLEDLIDAKVLGGFTVRSVTGSLRLDTDSDVAMARVLVAMANKSSADTARRVARAAKQQAIEGVWHGGRVPFGYRAEAGALVIDPVTGPLVVEMYQRVLAGDSLYRIRKDWNTRGILTTHGCAWSDRTLKMVLYNPSNKGVREYRPVMPDGSRARTSKMHVKAAWPALVDEDTWQQVSDVLDARKKARNFHQPGGGADVSVLGANPLLTVRHSDDPSGLRVPVHPAHPRRVYPFDPLRRNRKARRGSSARDVRADHPPPHETPNLRQRPCGKGRARGDARRRQRTSGAA